MLTLDCFRRSAIRPMRSLQVEPMAACRYCRGTLTEPRARVCRRCMKAKGRRTVTAWLASLVKARSSILIDHRVTNDLEAFEAGEDVGWDPR